MKRFLRHNQWNSQSLRGLLAPDTGEGDGGGGAIPPATGNDGDDAGGGENPPSGGDDTALQKALKAERDARKEAERSLRELQAKQAEIEQAALADQGKFQELAEQRGTQLTALEKAKADLEAQVEASVKQSTEALEVVKKQVDAVKSELKIPKSVEELLADKSPIQQLDWLSKNRSELSAAGAPRFPSTPDGNGGANGKGWDPEKQRLAFRPF